MNDSNTEQLLYALGENGRRDRTLVRWLICLVALACAVGIMFGLLLWRELGIDRKAVHADFMTLHDDFQCLNELCENRGSLLEKVGNAQTARLESLQEFNALSIEAHRLALRSRDLMHIYVGNSQGSHEESLKEMPLEKREAWKKLRQEISGTLTLTAPFMNEGAQPLAGELD